MHDLQKAALAGSAAAICEVGLDHPLFTLKTRLQDPKIPAGAKWTLNPRILYTGFVPNLLSMTPITVLQMGTAKVLENLLKGDTQEASTQLQLLSKTGGGAFAALLANPMERIMAHMGDKKFFKTTQHMIKQEGFKSLLIGFWGTAFRDGIFTAAYAFGGSYLAKQCRPILPKEWQARLAGGVLSGVSAAILTQPADTVRTHYQTLPLENRPKGMLPMMSLAKDIFLKEGMLGLYKGGLPRGLRVVSAVCVMSAVSDKVTEALNSPKP